MGSMLPYIAYMDPMEYIYNIYIYIYIISYIISNIYGINPIQYRSNMTFISNIYYKYNHI